MPSVFGKVRQIGYMSRDLDQSMQYFVDAWGVGPWYTLRNVKASMLYRGTPTELEISIAMANCGDLQFEIVTQHDDAPSLYQEALAHTNSLHVQHMAIWAQDVAAVEAEAYHKGWQSVFETVSGPGRSVFVTHHSAPQVCIEISDCDPFKERARAEIQRIAATWDGTDPVREGLPK